MMRQVVHSTDLGDILRHSQRQRWPVGGWPHQRLWGDLQPWPFDLGVLHLRLPAGLRQVDVLVTDVLLLSSATEATHDDT